MTLTEFLLARIAEDEAVGQAAVSDWYSQEKPLQYAETGYNTTPDLTIDPRRVLAECEAKRRIVEVHAEIHENGIEESLACAACSPDDGAGGRVWDWPCDTVRLLSLPYADHPDYREEWRP